MLTENEKKVIALIQGDIPICEKPYKILAEKAQISEEEFIAALKSLKDKKVIRRYGATLRHQKTGFSANAMVAWNIPEEKIHDIGKIMAKFSFVSHCYRRNPVNEWPYNLYTMVHAISSEDCISKVKKMSMDSRMEKYRILYSKKELKKISMEYFTDIV
ncbi:MAG: AsnC family protein [Deltaproteobacteria bacterium]|nr:MAG: AsnC family protein [Deltaproteobacteria bacterium]